MKRRFLIASLVLGTVSAQSVAPERTPLSGDTVVVTINGRKFTASEIRRIVEASPVPQAKAMFERSPKDFLRAQGVLMAYADVAMQQELDKKSPYKEILEFYRLFVLSNAALNHQRAQFSIPPEQQLAYYNSHSEDYREARVRMIYVPFEDEKSEALAKSKAADFAKQARSGVDFVKLAKSNEKESTVATGEEFVVKPDSNQPPEQMRKVLLASKAGTITDPLRHDNGYYVFRIESVAVQPYASVKDEIFRKLGDDHAREWQNKIQGQITVQIENEAFFQSNAKQ